MGVLREFDLKFLRDYTIIMNINFSDLKFEIVDVERFTCLYKEKICTDFPAAERRPLSMMKKRIKEKFFTCYALTLDNTIYAYAVIINNADSNYKMLELFAVDKSFRGSGLGGHFLSVLKENIKCDGLLLECECPDSARTEDERNLRIKRIHFYEKNTAVVTPAILKAFGVMYNILYLPFSDTLPPKNCGFLVKDFYSKSVPPILNKLFVKVIK